MISFCFVVALASGFGMNSEVFVFFFRIYLFSSPPFFCLGGWVFDLYLMHECFSRRYVYLSGIACLCMYVTHASRAHGDMTPARGAFEVLRVPARGAFKALARRPSLRRPERLETPARGAFEVLRVPARGAFKALARRPSEGRSERPEIRRPPGAFKAKAHARPRGTWGVSRGARHGDVRSAWRYDARRGRLRRRRTPARGARGAFRAAPVMGTFGAPGDIIPGNINGRHNGARPWGV